MMKFNGSTVMTGYALIKQSKWCRIIDEEEEIVGVYSNVEDARNKVFEYYKTFDPLRYNSIVDPDMTRFEITAASDPKNDYTVFTIKETGIII